MKYLHSKSAIIFLSFLICVLSTGLYAQVEMGKWRMHLAYNSATKIAQTPNKIFVVSDMSLYSVGKEDYDLELYNKVSGLNGSSVSQIKYDESTKQLIIIYTNGNIDLMASGGIINVPDFYNKQMTSLKTVNHIYCYNSKAYLSTYFGILVLDLKRKEISDTYYIGPNASEVKVLATAIHNGILYAFGESQVYAAPLTANLVDYQYWTSIESTLPGSGNFQSAEIHNNNLFVLRNSVVYQYNGTSWSQLNITPGITSIKATENRLYISWGTQFLCYDQSMNETYVPHSGSDITYDSGSSIYWLASGNNGAVAYRVNGGTTSSYKPDGPVSNLAWDLTMVGDKLFVLPGSRWSAGDNIAGGVSVFENESWTKIFQADIQAVSGNSPLDFVNIAVHPSDNTHFFVTSCGTGLYEFRNNTFYQRHTQQNTGGILQSHSALANDFETQTRLDGAVFDANGNLFLTNSGVAAGIKLLLNNGTWMQLEYPDSRSEIFKKILINSNASNQKWVISASSAPGIFIFDDNGTPGNQSDDQSKFFKTFNYIENNEIKATDVSYFMCIAQDNDGVIWVGTNKGPLLFYNPSNVFNSDYLCSKVLIPRNDSSGLGDFLLNDALVTSLIVDGANRKWIGTHTSGVYLVSPNGVETIYHFTAENSPLPSNYVQSIAINPTTGEVFFGTPMGIASFQSNAAESRSNYSDIKAYPNPVREGYEGIITITGLVENSVVRITDAVGNLVCQTVSNGSIATWDGRDSRGKKVNTGVYVVLCASEDGSLSAATKILVFK